MSELKLIDSALLTPDEAAKYLNVKLSTVYQWSMRKTLPVVKLGRLNRFRRQDLDAFINQNITEVQKS
ncbi:MAG: helix-turn-helix domain-containing protein [Planctomycetes bacterium]|nr:helix-turn-helix domain-containing protein [Planctomycetota bacterium]